MALIPNAYLKADPTTVFRDQQHAARLFVDDNLRLAPKHSFLFHVAFSINEAALKTITLTQRHRNEINMLVKSCSLPSFKIKADTMNQYNRKKNVQTTHTYDPVTIKFHDDSMGLINQLWQNYYSYYYADSTSANNPGAYNRTATKHANYINNSYGLDNGSTLPFFNYITIYQMARGEFVSYKLHNPIIDSWNHETVDYAKNGAHENTVSLMYEAVSYGSGEVVPGNPEGFALEHYDLTPSPLTGNSDSLTSASPSFVTTQSLINKSANFLSNAVTAVKSANTRPPSNPDTLNVIANAIESSRRGVSGIQGITFPTDSTRNITTATPVKLR